MSENVERNVCEGCGYGFPKERAGDGHVAVRFGDQMRYRVFLDDAEVSDHVDEAIATREGNPGQAHFVARLKGNEACGMKWGNVRVEARGMKWGNARVEAIAE